MVTVLAVDPGLQKCGLAVVNEEKGLLKKLIIPAGELPGVVSNLCRRYKVGVIVLGNKTGSRDALPKLKTLDLPVRLVDEHRSSFEGRYRYLKENVKGLARLIPIGLRSPDQPFDDYVAVILAERFFKTRFGKSLL